MALLNKTKRISTSVRVIRPTENITTLVCKKLWPKKEANNATITNPT